MQNVVVIGQTYFKLEHSKFWSNFEFDRNIFSGTGTRYMDSHCKCETILYRTEISKQVKQLLYIERASRVMFQYPIRSLIMWSRKYSRAWDQVLKYPYHLEIWLAHQEHCWRCACQISQWLDNSRYESRRFETLWDLIIRQSFRILKQGPGVEGKKPTTLKVVIINSPWTDFLFYSPHSVQWDHGHY